MPIKKENRHLYPPKWKEISKQVRARAGNKCEFCGLKNGLQGARDMSGRFWTTPQILDYKHKPQILRPTNIKIVLTVAHLDHDPRNNLPENLKALCQACHLKYDQKLHLENSAKTRAMRGGQMILFDNAV